MNVAVLVWLGYIANSILHSSAFPRVGFVLRRPLRSGYLVQKMGGHWPLQYTAT